MNKPVNRPLDAQQRAAFRHAAGLCLALAALLAAVSLGCSIGEALVGGAQPSAPTATKTPRPTFTPLPGALTVAPASTEGVRGALPPGVTLQPQDRPSVIDGTTRPEAGTTHLIIYATETPAPSPTLAPAGPTPTTPPDVETNRPTRQAGPRQLPTPYVIINTATINGRRGPATAFERIGQAKKGDELLILARTADGAWFQVCCMANQPVWVSADLVLAKGPVDTVPVVTPPPTPTPVPPRPPAATRAPTPTPMPPFDVARGPEFPITRDNGVLTVWVKVYEGMSPYEKPLSGYILKITRDGVDVSDNVQSFSDKPFDTTSAKEGAYDYNLKFELYHAGEADWQIYLAKPGGFRMSPITQFTTKGDSYRNLVVYVAYLLAR